MDICNFIIEIRKENCETYSFGSLYDLLSRLSCYLEMENGLKELKGNLKIAPYWKNIRKGILGNDNSDKLSYIGFFSVHIRFSLRGLREKLTRYRDGKLILFK